MGATGWCEGAAFLLLKGATPYLAGNANTPDVTPLSVTGFNAQMEIGEDELNFLLLALLDTGHVNEERRTTTTIMHRGRRDPNQPFPATGRPPIMYAFDRRFKWGIHWLIQECDAKLGLRQ